MPFPSSLSKQRRIPSCLAALVLFAGAAALLAQPQLDHIVFDEDDPIGLGYYDASVGTGPGLAMAGPFNDKMPVSTARQFSGSHSGILSWNASTGPKWVLRVFNPGFAPKDIRGYSNLVFRLNGPKPLPSGVMPEIHLESSLNRAGATVALSEFLEGGLDDKPETWQQVSIPLDRFNPPGQFDSSDFRSVVFKQSSGTNQAATLWLDDLRVSTGRPVQLPQPKAPENVMAVAGDRSVALYWDLPDGAHLAGFHVYKFNEAAGRLQRLTKEPATTVSFADNHADNGSVNRYVVRTVNLAGGESEDSLQATALPNRFADDAQFLDYLQRASFEYFWREANPTNGLVRDRSQRTSASSIAAVGFGLTGIGIAADRGWIPREAGRDRTLRTLRTFWDGPQGTNALGTIGYKGWFYHFLEMDSATRSGSSELSSIDTALLLGGVLYSRQFFDGEHADEKAIRELAEAIFNRVDWKWMTDGGNTLTMGWMPDTGFLPSRWTGYNEAMILYIMALGAGQQALAREHWDAWTKSYQWQEQFGREFVIFPPLFGHQYSHCWIDFRNIADAYMRGKGITYFENSRRATLAQRDYALANPRKHPGYSADIWGFTACDGPGSPGTFAYMARGAPPAEHDDGTIAPTAAGGSISFAPEVCIPALRAMYDLHRGEIWTGYGFRDAFNISAGWFASDVLGIDQGPILVVAENFRTGSVWRAFMKNPEIRRGLQRAGFEPFQVAQ